MRVSTRLLLTLLPVVTAVMSVYAVWALSEREDVMVEEAQQETGASALTLAIALDDPVRRADSLRLRDVSLPVTRAPAGYDVAVYDRTGRRLYTSDTVALPSSPAAADLQRVLRRGETVTLERTMAGSRVFAVLRPILDGDGQVDGAVEVAQPLARIDAEKTRVRRHYLLNTLTLLAAVTLLTLYLVRRTVGQPMRALVAGVRAVGRGELEHRVGPALGGGELADLGREFDTMATNLESARRALLREGAERVALERRVRENEKLAAIGTLAAGLAHEIAAPLNVISGRAEMLLRREAPPDVRERHLRSIVGQIGRITGIVNNLLHFARRREPRLQRVDAAVVVDGVADMLEETLTRAHVRFDRTEGGPFWVQADPDLLHQVFVNLVLNAVQALENAPGERVIRLRTSVPEVPGPGWRVIEVEDSGPGIEPDRREQVFDPFFTTKANGTGLGLALARSMVVEQGGRLDAGDPAAGRGALFRVILPSPEEQDV